MVAAHGKPVLESQAMALAVRDTRRHVEEAVRRGTGAPAIPVPLYPAQPGGVVTVATGSAVLLFRGRFIAMSSGILINAATWTHYGGTAPFAQGQFSAQAIDSDGTAWNATPLTVGPTGGANVSAAYLRGITIPVEQIGELIVVNIFGHLAAGGAGSNVSVEPYYCLNCDPDLANSPL